VSAPNRSHLAVGGVICAALVTALAIAWTVRVAPAERLTLTPVERLRLGERIYRDGVLPSGAPLRGVHPGGGEAIGPFAACVQCHRRSGMGNFEGNRIIPPIAGPLLFQPRARSSAELDGRHTRGPDLAHAAGRNRPRPPYTRATLLRALRDGVDASGHALDLVMPRFALDEDDAQVLVDYLAQLSTRWSPGVGPDTLRFATVVTPGVDPRRRQAMIDVLSAFFAVRNAGNDLAVRRERAYAGSPPVPHRTWELEVWQLKGAPDTWRAQLAAFARRRPPFALVSGISDGEWAPVHDFCERWGVPCWFPTVDLPVAAEDDFYSLYFSGGVALEAQLLASQLPQPELKRVIQLRGGDGAAAGGARALAAALANSGLRVEERAIAGLDAATLRAALVDTTSADAVVFWLRPADLARLAEVPVPRARVYFSTTLAGDDPAQFPLAWRAQAELVEPFALSAERRANLSRFHVWLRTRGLELVDERVQSEAWLACQLLAEKIDEMLETLTRDYLIERAEAFVSMHMTTGLYHRLSLGPAQRFASKGGYLARFAPDGAIVAASDWTVPQPR
jgi:cytochrome c